MRVPTWNVKGAFPYQAEDEIEAQIEYLAGLAEPPDLLLLNEVNQYRREFIRELIRDELEYDAIVDTLSWAHELRESNVQPHHDIGHTTAISPPSETQTTSNTHH